MILGTVQNVLRQKYTQSIPIESKFNYIENIKRELLLLESTRQRVKLCKLRL